VGNVHNVIRPRQPIDLSVRGAARLGTFLLAFVCLLGCSNMVVQDDPMPAAGPDPAYGTIVSHRLKELFKNLSSSDAVEISRPSWVHTMIGWSWLSCVHFQDQGHRRTFAFFIRGSDIIDARFAVQTDGCGAQNYASLDLATGAIASAAAGEPAPLH